MIGKGLGSFLTSTLNMAGGVQQLSTNPLDAIMGSPDPNLYLHPPPPSVPDQFLLNANAPSDQVINSTMPSTSDALVSQLNYAGSATGNLFSGGVQGYDYVDSLFNNGLINPVTGSFNWQGPAILIGLALAGWVLVKAEI